MSRFRKVDAGTWGDARFAALSQDAKLLWLYLLTGPEVTSLPGLIVAGRAHLSEVMGWDTARFEAAFAELGAEDEEGAPMAKADWTRRVVWLPKAFKYNRPANSKVVVGWRDHWRVVPECPLKLQAFRTLRSFAESLGEQYLREFDLHLAYSMPSAVDTVSDTVSVSVPRARATAPAPDTALSEGVQGERQGVTPITSSGIEMGIADVYAAAVRSVVSVFALNQAYGRRELRDVLNQVVPAGLSFADLSARVAHSAKAYAEDRRDQAKFEAGFRPSSWAKWLTASEDNAETISRPAPEAHSGVHKVAPKAPEPEETPEQRQAIIDASQAYLRASKAAS